MGFEKFMRKNQVIDDKTVEFPVTETLKDENGKPLLWKFKKIPSKLMMTLQREGSESEIALKIISHCCVYPDLNDSELQDSYGVKKPTDLLLKMVPDGVEMNNLLVFINKMNRNISINDEIEEAKN